MNATGAAGGLILALALAAASVAQSEEQPIENPNTLRRGTPPEIAEQVRALGHVVAVGELARIYADLPHRFGPDDVAVTEELSYGPDARHALQVYASADRAASFNAPVLVLVHGGGFTAGSLDSMVQVATHYAGLGFVVVNITYPLAPDHTWPAGARAVGLAADWAAAHAEEYGGDPARIVVIGSSAGATHVAAYAFTPSLLPEGTTEAAGVILLSPGLVIDSSPISTAYYGDAPSAAEMGVVENVERASIPVLVTNAEHDPDMFYQSTAGLLDVLVNEHGVRPRYRQIPDHAHGSHYFTTGTSDRLLEEEILDFVASVGP